MSILRGHVARAIAPMAFTLMTGAAVGADGVKFHVDGEVLTYDTEDVPENVESGIVSDDVDTLLEVLRANNAVRALHLNSTGGEVYAAIQMSDIVIDFELDTHVHGDCDSSCVTIFLAGNKRTMSRGSRLGFHQNYWSARNIEEYYDRERISNDWDTPFEFAQWMYRDTQAEVFEHLSYMIERGVDAGFAVSSIRESSGEMWRPYRSELLKSGVLTE